MNIVAMVKDKLDERRAVKSGVSVEKLRAYKKAKAKTLYLHEAEMRRKTDEKIIEAKEKERYNREVEKAKQGPLLHRLAKGLKEAKARRTVRALNPQQKTEAFTLGNGSGGFDMGANPNAFSMGDKKKRGPF